MLLHPRVRERFSFEPEGSDTIGGHVVERIADRETTRPTLICTARGGDILRQGQFVDRTVHRNASWRGVLL